MPYANAHRRRAYDRKRKAAANRSKVAAKFAIPTAASVAIESASDVLAVLNSTLQAIGAAPMTVGTRAALTIRLARVALACVAAANLEPRLDEVERLIREMERDRCA